MIGIDAVEHHHQFFVILLHGVLGQMHPILEELVLNGNFVDLFGNVKGLKELAKVVIHFLIGHSFPVPVDLPDIVVAQVGVHNVAEVLYLGPEPIDADVGMRECEGIEQWLADISFGFLVGHPLLHDLDELAVLLSGVLGHQGNRVSLLMCR